MVRRVDMLLSVMDTLEEIKNNIMALENKWKHITSIVRPSTEIHISRLKEAVRCLEKEIDYLLELYREMNEEIKVEEDDRVHS